MSCSSCMAPKGSLGHFGAYVKASPAQIFTTTGQVIKSPNETAGMHVNRLSPRTAGLGDYFGPTQTRWIEGVDNEWVALGGAAILVVLMMR